MVNSAPVFFGAVFLLLLSFSSSAPCKKEDWKQLMLPCSHDPKTRTRSLVYYLNANCSGGVQAPAPVHGIPCDCPPGKGLSGTLNNHKCLPCEKGHYGAGGEIINNWGLWTNNGSTPPEELGIITFCLLSRNYYTNTQTCHPWKATADNLTVESGDNAMSRCVTSVLMITKKFVMPDSRVSFDYRVDGRKCRSPSHLMGCDGLGFFIDDKQVVNHSGSEFLWSTVTFNLTTGIHTLKWTYRKTCYSYPSPSFTDKAFIRSITLVGTAEPNVTCSQCPPGYYSDQIGASSCKPCPYFHHQPQKGQSKCEACPADTFSLLGAANCLPLPNCTDDDIIAAPGNLSTCSVAPNGSIVTTVSPEYMNVQGLTSKPLCKPVDSKPLSPSHVLCSCQPGFKIRNDGDKVTCQPCDKGSYSEGLKCIQCQKGHVALPGKHFALWHYRTLPEGFSTNCVGDCSIEGGWISAGNHIRTGHAIGNLDSYLQTPTFSVDSLLAFIMFNCSVRCFVSGIQKTGNKPPRGENLANIQDCNLVFEMYVNDTLVDQMNCTSPKGKYVHRHDNRRDGEIIEHVYLLKKANYSFRWVFHQVDETRSLSADFEGKIYNISVLGVRGGEAGECTQCGAGSRSVSDNTDCVICPVGTASSAGSDTCNRCGQGYFAPKEGSKTCLRCGNNTKPTKNQDGCDTNNCKFSPAPGVEYDLSKLSRPGGPMIEVLPYQTSSRTRPRWWGLKKSVLSIWPTKPSFYVNLCTLEHENTSCTHIDTTTGLKKSLPVMACRASWWSPDVSLGTVISYNPKKDVRSGLIVELLHGDRCYTGNSNYSTTLDMVCDVKAGVGNPGPENNYTDIMRGYCRYYFVWRSLYACPKCRKIDVTAIYGACVNGTRNITYIRSLPCWGFGNATGVPVPKTEKCVMPTETVTVVVNTTVVVNATMSYLVKESSKVNNILIGVGVVVIVALLAVAGLFVYKHRIMKYRYYTLMARNKPMSRLEKEDDENSFFGDQELDPFDSATGPVKT